MRIALLACSLTCSLTLAVPTIAYADVFRWVDEKGVSHYTLETASGTASVDVAAAPAAAHTSPTATLRRLRAQLALAQLPGPREIPPARRIPAPRTRAASGETPERLPVAPKPGRDQVQLAALRSADQAWYEWVRLHDHHDDLLGGLEPHVVAVDLGARGRFFRLSVGPVDDAVAFCERLAQRRVSCLADPP